jgi:AraC family transcriptional regulator
VLWDEAVPVFHRRITVFAQNRGNSMGETSAVTFGPPRIEQRGRLLLAGLRRKHAVSSDMSVIMRSVEDQWVSFRPRRRELRHALNSDSYGILLKVFDGDVGIEYFCGMEVSEASDLPEGFVTLDIPPLRYAMVRHTGTADELLKTYFDIFGKLLPEAGLTVSGGRNGAPEFIERFDSLYSLETRTGGPVIMVPLSD